MNPIVLFDGVCNLCSASVQFIITHDPEAHFRFASLQSAFGRATQQRFGFDPDALNSLILIENDRVYTRSEAALRIARHLQSGWWRSLYALRVVPRPLRDWIYDFVARRRYRWFGQKESCWLPTPDLRRRFLDSSV